MNVRADAMRSYFGFLKEAGRHLDPKTRAIISVITKVDNQTEEGFRQYLPKALQAGASADEVLDALLYAFPTLGLTKIVWAVNILLEMDLPEFRPEQLGRQAGWQDVMAVAELPESGSVYISNGGRSFFIHKSGDEIRVYDNHCPHQNTAIPEQAIDGETLRCPRHGWCFDLRSGECIRHGDRPLRQYEYKFDAGRLWVYC
jgi:nitrite reductase/ring-hydroxylating ferredoxin subunit